MQTVLFHSTIFGAYPQPPFGRVAGRELDA